MDFNFPIKPKLIVSIPAPSRSKEGVFYNVELFDDGTIKCDCQAGSMNRWCHHKDEALDYFSNLIELIKQKKNEQTRV